MSLWIPELGLFLLLTTLCFSIMLAVVPWVGRATQTPEWGSLTVPLCYGQLFFATLCFICLVLAFVTNDFSVSYVASHSNTALPLLYRIAATWGAHEGSMLLWLEILTIWTAVAAKRSALLPTDVADIGLAILGAIAVGLGLFILLTSDPFQRLLPDMPMNGRDLNPLLQDFGLAIHPPILYAGYVGFVVPFAFALAALMVGELDALWANWLRPFVLCAFAALTAGITLGSWWAYRELGWGGWWFWDPVENASLMPWLTGTALVHSLLATEKRGTLKNWSALLAITTFSLSLLGTFLVRSGVLTSVHAFASDPSRGLYMLIFLLLVVGISLTIYMVRAKQLHSERVLSGLARENFLLVNNLLLLVIMLTVLLGTLYPLILDAFDLGKLSVGAPYFNAVFVPLVLPLLWLLGVAPHAKWQEMSARNLFLRLRWMLLVTFLLAVMLLAVEQIQGLPLMVVLGVISGLWVLLTTFYAFIARIRQNGIRNIRLASYGMILAHIGVAITVLGVTITSYYSVEKDVHIAPGQDVMVGPYQFQFMGVKDIVGSNYKGVAGGFLVSENGKAITFLEAEKRIYLAQNMPMTDAAISANLWRDLYVAMSMPVSGDAWAVRLYYKPFVRWIWAGGLLMMCGGLLAALGERRRLPILSKLTMPILQTQSQTR